MRLINADAAFDALDEKIPPDEISDYIAGLIDAMQHIVNDAPEIDAQPVRHAYWIESPDPDVGDHKARYQCSRCHKTADRISRYCPNCGAKMDPTAETGEVNL